MDLMTRIDRWEPFEELSTLRNRMDRILNRFSEQREDEPLLTAEWAPVADVIETKDAFVLRTELPGVDEKDINVELENNMLTIQGERKFEKKGEDKGYRRIERSYGKFMRAFTLPQNVNPEKINAAFGNGVLELTVPKKEEAKPKKISLDIKKKIAATV